MIAIVVAGVALASALTAWVTYLATVPGGNVPARPVGGIALAISGVLAAGVAIALSQQSGAHGIAVGVPAGLAVLLGLGFVFVLSQRKTPIGNLAVKVGDRLLAFASQTSHEVAFHTDELAGRRTLIKFFRGHW